MAETAEGGQIGEAFPEGIGELPRLMSSLQDTVALVRERAEAADARADAAEADRRAARSNALRTTIDEMRAGQGLMQDMHARELEAAHQQARQAQEAADKLRGR
jgi:hypothetical protein